MKFVDLHTHSIVTDGSYTPKELVESAKKAGLAALAITDHDNLHSYAEAKAAADVAGIGLMAGIEMSVNYKGGRLHVLGLGFDPHNRGFQAAYKEFRRLKEDCVPPLLEWLWQRGICLDEAALAPYRIGALDRYTVFRYFSAREVWADVQSIWDEYLNPALEGVNLNIELREAISLIKDAGGITSLAHYHKNLGLKRFSLTEKEACIRELRDMGLDALEAQYSDFTDEERMFIGDMAEKYGMLRTGGTDFHGANRPAVQLGSGTGGSVAVPYEWYEKILERCKRKG